MRCRCHFYMSYIPQFVYCLLNVYFLYIYYKLHMKAAQLGLWGGSSSPFSALFHLWTPLGTKMVPRRLPKASGTPPDINFYRFFLNF